MDSAPMHTAETLAQDAANSIDPTLFEPAIRKAADEFYEQLLTGVQDYLKDNVQFNSASHIYTLEYGIRQLRKSNAELVAASQGYMSQFGQALDCNGIQYGPPQIEADERLRIAIANATGIPT